MSMFIDGRGVRAAERAVSERKAELGMRWSAMRTRVGDKLVQPSTLLSAAVVGGVIGWRGGAPKPKAAAEEAGRSERAAQKPTSLLSGAFRSIAIAGLQVVASIASEELLRSSSRGGERGAAKARDDVSA